MTGEGKENMREGWAINMLHDVTGGPERVRVHATTEHADSSYGIPVWVDDEGNSYGQVGLYPLGWRVDPDNENAAQ